MNASSPHPDRPVSEMERLARVVCAYDGDDPDVMLGDGFPYWKGNVPLVRAVLEAMRTPSEPLAWTLNVPAIQKYIDHILAGAPSVEGAGR